jgi:hypothetical protein
MSCHDVSDRCLEGEEIIFVFLPACNQSIKPVFDNFKSGSEMSGDNRVSNVHVKITIGGIIFDYNAP